MNELVELKWQEFEAVGEKAIRQKLSTTVYSADNRRIAQDWLDFKDRSRNEASNLEQRRTARSAKTAAWIAATAATIAAICSAFTAIQGLLRS